MENLFYSNFSQYGKDKISATSKQLYLLVARGLKMPGIRILPDFARILNRLQEEFNQK